MTSFKDFVFRITSVNNTDNRHSSLELYNKESIMWDICLPYAGCDIKTKSFTFWLWLVRARSRLGVSRKPCIWRQSNRKADAAGVAGTILCRTKECRVPWYPVWISCPARKVCPDCMIWRDAHDAIGLGISSAGRVRQPQSMSNAPFASPGCLLLPPPTLPGRENPEWKSWMKKYI